MNCLYITLFFNIVAGIVQTFMKSWNQLLYPRVIEVCLLPFWTTSWLLLAPHHCCRTSFGEFTAPLRHILPIHNVIINSNNLFVNFHWTFTFCVEKSYDATPLAFGGTWISTAISNRSHSNKAGYTTVNEHGSQVKDRGRRQCCHNKHKKFPYRPTHDVPLLSGHISYFLQSTSFWEIYEKP